MKKMLYDRKEWKEEQREERRTISILEIYEELRYLAQIALKIRKEAWDSYDVMNSLIIERLL